MGMKRSFPRFSSSSLLAALLTQSFSVMAQEQSGPAAAPEALAPPAASAPVATTDATASAPEAAPASNVATTAGPIFVTVSLSGYVLPPEQVAEAIARELNVALSAAPEAARNRFEVVAVKGADMSVTFRDQTGQALKRVVKAPANDAQVGEVAALLAVNLAQDPSNELLTQLAPAPAPVPATVSPAPSQPAPAVAAQSEGPPRAPELPFVVVNGTVAHPLSIVRDVDERTVGFELGLFYSRVGAVQGAAINPLVLQVRQSTEGVLIAGLGSVAGSGDYTTPQETARVAGLFNYGRGPLQGVGIAGAVDLEYVEPGTGLGLLGAQLSGLMSFVNADAEGVQVAGATNFAHGLTGSQIGGLVNVANGPADGAQMAGAVNYAERIGGTQIAGLGNVALGDVEGAQVSGGVNVAGDVDGAQIGLINVGKHVRGTQIGLVNVANEVDGASVGLVTYSKKGQTQLTTWYDSTRPVNVGARFVSGALYAMPMVGGDPTTVEEFSFGLSFGARVPVDRLYFDLEGNSSNEFKDGRVDESAVDLRYRGAVGFRVTPWLGVFAGGGVRHRFHAKDGGEHRVRGLWNVGVDIF